MSSQDTKDTVATVVAILPIAIDLVEKLVGLAEKAKGDGVEVPGIEKLRDISSRLDALADL